MTQAQFAYVASRYLKTGCALQFREFKSAHQADQSGPALGCAAAMRLLYRALLDVADWRIFERMQAWLVPLTGFGVGLRHGSTYTVKTLVAALR